jgi:nucleoside phosphorylase/CheY-like chemotaxis protein
VLSVLLAEDDPAKKGRLLGFLSKKKGTLFSRVDTTLSVAETLKALRETHYDLLIVDVILPAVLGGEPHEGSCIELLTQIDEGVSVQRPHYALAISASAELSKEAREFFVGRPWGILPYSESSDEALATLERIAQYILEGGSRQAKTRPCDVFVFTALMEPEYAAIEAAGIEWGPLEPLDEMQFVRYGELRIGTTSKLVAAAFAPRMGAVAAAVLVSKAIAKLNPKLLLMAGICAGIPSKAGIGDVIAADISWDWHSGKYVDRGGAEHFEIGPDQIAIDEKTRSQVFMMKRDKPFWTSLGAISAKYSQKTPKLVVGPIATGSAVLADERIADRIRSTQHRALAGLDMEVYGAYAAARAWSADLRYLALKAVCDLGDRTKDDKFQAYAAEVSAASVLHFLSNYAAPLLE